MVANLDKDMFVKRCNLLTAVDKSEQAPHKSPPLNQYDYTTESASYATFTIEGKGHTLLVRFCLSQLAN